MTLLTNLLVLLATLPVPRDIPLPLPLIEADLEIIIVALFLLHILFVNLMVGGAAFVVLFEVLGRWWPRFDKLARVIASTITVNKSLAVVLGVGPLLAINLLYTTWFYSANALTGHVWAMVIPVVILAFLLSYLHKYSWASWTGKKKGEHIGVGVAALLLYLGIPFIFLANINLMLFPESWSEVAGYFSTLSIGNVFPRYFHFLTATMAITALFLAGYLSRRGAPEGLFEGGAFSRDGLRRLFLAIAFWMTALQFIFGPLLYATLPQHGLSWTLFWVVLAALVAALGVLALLYTQMRRRREVGAGRGYLATWVLLGVLVALMGTARHIYREGALAEHRKLVAERTARFAGLERGARMRLAAGMDLGGARTAGPTPESVFTNCAACHSMDNDRAAPSIPELQRLYSGDVEGIVQWAREPGKKREQYAPMPSFAHLGEEKLTMAARYMLELGDEEPEGSGG